MMKVEELLTSYMTTYIIFVGSSLIWSYYYNWYIHIYVYTYISADIIVIVKVLQILCEKYTVFENTFIIQ